MKSVPDSNPPDRFGGPPAPQDFAEEVERAARLGQIGKLALLGSEAQGLVWQADGLRIVAAAQAQLRAAPGAAQVIMFTGHMIDAPERAQARFPAACEANARHAIQAALQSIVEDPQQAIGLAGGACGGDILFHEECARLGVATRFMLTLPRALFIAASVAHAGPEWVSRFASLVDRHDDAVEILAGSDQLPAWLAGKADYDVWQRTNLWLLEEALSRGATRVDLLALWDGDPGDGPGGTQHLVETAGQRGVRVHVLSIKEIC